MPRRRIGFWYRLAAALCKPPLLVLFKRDWRGMENIPAEGGFLAVVNHNSYLDPLSYGHFQYNSGRVPRFLAKDGLFRLPVVGTVLRGSGQIPVRRGTAHAADAFHDAVEAVNSGECVAVYPEGTLTRDPGLWPMTGKTGAARIALRTGAPVVPVAQWGANEALPPYARHLRLRLFPRKTLKVMAGPPVDLSAFLGEEQTADVLRAATDTIMDAVTELLAELREEPAPAERFDPRRVGSGAVGSGAAGRPGCAHTGAARTPRGTGPARRARPALRLGRWTRPAPEPVRSADPVRGTRDMEPVRDGKAAHVTGRDAERTAPRRTVRNEAGGACGAAAYGAPSRGGTAHGAPARGDAVQGDAVPGEAVYGEAVRARTAREEAVRDDAPRNEEAQ